MSWFWVCSYFSDIVYHFQAISVLNQTSPKKNEKKQEHQNILSDFTKCMTINPKKLCISAFWTTSNWSWCQCIGNWISHFVHRPMNSRDKNQWMRKCCMSFWCHQVHLWQCFLSKFWTRKQTLNSCKIKMVHDIRKRIADSKSGNLTKSNSKINTFHWTGPLMAMGWFKTDL